MGPLQAQQPQATLGLRPFEQSLGQLLPRAKLRSDVSAFPGVETGLQFRRKGWE